MGTSSWAANTQFSTFPHCHLPRENTKYLGNQPLGSVGSVFGVCLFWLLLGHQEVRVAPQRKDWHLSCPHVLLAGCSLHSGNSFAAGQSLFGLR